MTENKLFSRICPKCGKLCQAFTVAKVDLGAGVHYDMQCENGHHWVELYTLSYQGYWYDGKKYNSYGVVENV